MDSLVSFERSPPALAERFREPSGFRWGTFPTDSGTLRWGHLPNPSAQRTCVLVGGFAEFIEKYFETAGDFVTRGFDVWCLDWHGQGASDRHMPEPSRPRARTYKRDADNLARFIGVMTPSDRPRMLVAHSMGAAIALLCLSRHPKVVDAAVLSAPMLRIPFPPVAHSLARAFTVVASTLGFGDRFAPGAGQWKAKADLCPANSRASNDPERCLLQRTWFEHDPRLRVDGPTLGWARASFALTAHLRKPALLRQVATPILLGSARKEQFVDPDAHRRAAKFLPHCDLVEFADAKHELFHETDAVRAAWFAAIDAFVATHIHGPAPHAA